MATAVRCGWCLRETNSPWLLAQQTPTGRRRSTVGNRGRNGQPDFSARAGSAFEDKFTADLPAAFTHTRNAIMAGAAVFEHFCRNAPPIVLDSQAKRACPVDQFCFNMLRSSVGKGVA